MNTHSLDDRIAALAPVPESLDEEWARVALTDILAAAPRQPRRRNRRRIAVIAVAGALTISTGTAVAAGLDSIDDVKDALLAFSEEPNTTGNGIGTLHTPRLVAEFPRSDGRLFSFWFATTSSGKVCFAYRDGGPTPPSPLEYGCAVDVADPTDPDHILRLERPDQLGGFFKDDEPILYGVSPYAGTVQVRVQGEGVDQTLPVRADSLGYGAAMPSAAGADSLTLTFLDAAGRALGARTVVAPVG
jgi:hypothetical protein